MNSLRLFVMGILTAGLFTGCTNLNLSSEEGEFSGKANNLRTQWGEIVGVPAVDPEDEELASSTPGTTMPLPLQEPQGVGQSELDALFDYSAKRDQREQILANAMTNRDIVAMVQDNSSQQDIIGSIQARKGKFDTSPTAETYLQSQGVSEEILREMRKNKLEK